MAEEVSMSIQKGEKTEAMVWPRLGLGTKLKLSNQKNILVWCFQKIKIDAKKSSCTKFHILNQDKISVITKTWVTNLDLWWATQEVKAKKKNPPLQAMDMGSHDLTLKLKWWWRLNDDDDSIQLLVWSLNMGDKWARLRMGHSHLWMAFCWSAYICVHVWAKTIWSLSFI